MSVPMVKHALVALAVIAAARPAAGQDRPVRPDVTTASSPAAAPQESRFRSDLRREGQHISEACGSFKLKSLGGCAYTLTTDYPFHLALGSLAPQNGFAFGLAFSERFTPNESWRLSWNADAAGTPSGSWRAGVYMRLIRTPELMLRPSFGGTSPGAAAESIGPRERPVINLLVQAISLDTLSFFGPGPESLESGRSVFGEQQTIVGGSVTYPLDGVRAIRWLKPALVGGIFGRFVDIRSGPSGGTPSIEELYDEQSAPGLSQQKPFVQFSEAVRLRPSVANGWLRFDYLLSAQQFRAAGDTQASFNRWVADLRHEIPLYRRVSSTGPRDFNGPNECHQSIGSEGCPPVQWSRNREGSIGFRLLVSTSTTSGGNRVPFYFQPTLGGSNVNGERILASYADYRFRAPNLISLQESVEHSIWGPFGVFFEAEQGKVASTRGDLTRGSFATTATVGLTLRAGGFPMVNLSFSWGGEGHHVIGMMNTSLLGGSARPSLY